MISRVWGSRRWSQQALVDHFYALVLGIQPDGPHLFAIDVHFEPHPFFHHFEKQHYY